MFKKKKTQSEMPYVAQKDPKINHPFAAGCVNFNQQNTSERNSLSLNQLAGVCCIPRFKQTFILGFVLILRFSSFSFSSTKFP